MNFIKNSNLFDTDSTFIKYKKYLYYVTLLLNYVGHYNNITIIKDVLR